MLNEKDLHVLERLENWLSAYLYEGFDEIPDWMFSIVVNNPEGWLKLIRKALQDTYKETLDKLYD